MRFSIIIFVLISSLFSSSLAQKKEDRAAKQLEIEMQKEKKYAKEQTFYNMQNYDLKGAEVNKDSLESLPEIEVDDFDMDSVYD